MSQVEKLELTPSLTSKSGKPLLIGSGSGTKWKALKRSDPSNSDNANAIIHQLKKSIKLGFYHIDAAEAYTTHPEVGEAIKQSGLARGDIFLTTKYSPGSLLFEKRSKGPEDFINIALRELQTDYVDLLLIHHPFFKEELSNGYTLESAWKELIEIKKSGKTRYIGVSNSSVEHLKTIIKISEQEGTDYLPIVNQIEFHPYLQNQSPGIVKFSRENNILVEAYGPLTPLFRIVAENGDEIVNHPLKSLLPILSEKYGKTDAQILLRYTLQKGILPITTSSKEERIKQSLEVYQFELDDDDVKNIDEVGATFPYRSFFKNNFNS